MMKRSHIYILMNFFMPGVGQLALRRWVRGVLLVILFMTGFILLLWELIRPLCVSIKNLLPDGSGAIEKIDIIRIIILFFICLLVWVWSILDIVIWKPTEN